MRVRDRRFMIARHNKDAQQETQDNAGASKVTNDISRFTDLTLANKKNGNR